MCLLFPFFALFHWLKPRGTKDVLLLFPILWRKHLASTYFRKYDVSGRFLVDALYQVEEIFPAVLIF